MNKSEDMSKAVVRIERSVVNVLVFLGRLRTRWLLDEPVSTMKNKMSVRKREEIIWSSGNKEYLVDYLKKKKLRKRNKTFGKLYQKDNILNSCLTYI